MITEWSTLLGHRVSLDEVWESGISGDGEDERDQDARIQNL